MTITVTETTPRKNIQVGGVILKAPTPFEEGHTLSANEAAAINQTYLENLGNNFRSFVTKAKKLYILGKEDAKADELKTVTDAQVKKLDAELEASGGNGGILNIAGLQSAFDEMIQGYQMGVRRTSSVTAYSPEERAARAIAKDKLKNALSKRGTKLNTVSADWWEREIARLLDKENPVLKGEKNITEDIWGTAERQVRLLAQAAQEGLDDLDMSGIEKEDDTEESEEEESEEGNGTEPVEGEEVQAKSSPVRRSRSAQSETEAPASE